jgi:dTDP-glucose 4,6-dehydratase
MWFLSTTGFNVGSVYQPTNVGNVAYLREVESSNRYCFEKTDICDRAKLGEIFSYSW